MMTNELRRYGVLGSLLVLVAFSGCTESSERSSTGSPTSPGNWGNDPSTGGALAATGGSTATGGSPGLDGGLGGAGEPPLPDEVEENGAFRAPVATGDYLWFANPESSRVALIHTVTLDVQVLTAGFRPTFVAAVPRPGGESSALVLNLGSADATWFRVKNGKVASTRIDTHEGANRLTVAPSGDWAVLWSAKSRGVALDPTDGLQDIMLVDFRAEKPKTYELTVGYRPSEVVFDSAESRVIVVAEHDVNIVSLDDDAPAVSSWFDLGNSADRDVAVTPSGTHALVRRKGDSKIEILPLDGSASTFVELGGPVTDLDLSADGKRAVAVVRDARQLAVLPLPGIVADPEDFDVVTVQGELFGSAALTADGKTAALYTNAVQSDRVVVVDLNEGENYLQSRVVSVKAPVSSLTTTPDGEHAIGLLGAPAGSNNAGSFVLIPLRAERFPRVVGTLSRAREVAVASDYALVTTEDALGKVHEAHLLRMPSLSVDSVRLSSPPLAAGILGERGLGYVAQSHSEGRVTILDFEKSAARTLTGFELAAKVVE